MRRLLIVLACFVLSGCWYGLGLYSNSDARPAIPPGVYHATGDGPDRAYRISILPSGLTQFDVGEKGVGYGFAPLDRKHGTFVAWANVEDDNAATDGRKGTYQMFALMVRKSNNEFLIYAPDCKDEGADIAREVGATIETGTPPACRFPTRAALEKALQQVPRKEDDALTLTRIP
jgi:hypothetical protein